MDKFTRYPTEMVATRLFTDMVSVIALGGRPVRWAEANLENMGEERSAYISALREADKGNFSLLVQYLTKLNTE